MKFFKHFIGAHSSTSMNLIIDDLGLSGYAHFFILLELCVAKWSTYEDGTEHCEFRFHRVRLARDLRTRPDRVDRILGSFQGRGQLTWTRCGDELIIKIPKLLKSLDRNYKYNRKRVVSQSQNAITELEEEREEEREEEEGIKEKPTPAFEIYKSRKTETEIRESIPIFSYEKWVNADGKDFVEEQISAAINYYMAEPGHEFWNSLGWVRKINAWIARSKKMGGGRSRGIEEILADEEKQNGSGRV